MIATTCFDDSVLALASSAEAVLDTFTVAGTGGSPRVAGIWNEVKSDMEKLLPGAIVRLREGDDGEPRFGLDIKSRRSVISRRLCGSGRVWALARFLLYWTSNLNDSTRSQHNQVHRQRRQTHSSELVSFSTELSSILSPQSL